jgi:hypothetical protein
MSLEFGVCPNGASCSHVAQAHAAHVLDEILTLGGVLALGGMLSLGGVLSLGDLFLER